MTILVTGYASKKELKASVGKRLEYMETSLVSPEYKSDGELTVAHHPVLGFNPKGREFFARVTMKCGKIAKVS